MFDSVAPAPSSNPLTLGGSSDRSGISAVARILPGGSPQR